MDQRGPTSFPVVASGRRVRLSPPHLRALFGDEHALSMLLALDDEGLFAALETVTVKGPAGAIGAVRVLGPVAATSTVELLSDDFALIGVTPGSGRSIEGSPGVLLEGPKGSVALAEGALVVMRHLRLHPEHARLLGLRDGELVDVRVDGDRARVFAGLPVSVVGADGPPKSVMVVDAEDANTLELDARTRATIVDDAHGATVD